MRLLNVGCGATYHPEWINLDAAPVSPGPDSLYMEGRKPAAT